jgi:hypothetical protein
MTKLEKASLIEYLKGKYRRANKLGKGLIIDELCERLKVHRKHGIRLLSSKPVGRPKKPGRVGRPSKYQDVEFVDALKGVWKLTKRLCGRRLKSAIPDWLPAIEEEQGKYSEDIRTKLISISAPTIDRILRDYKKRHGLSTTVNGGFRDQIPIQGNIWDIQTPGYMEVDTVAHCGGSSLGEYVNSVTMVDIATLWTEVRAVFGKGSNAVFDGIKDIEDNLPFELLGYDADNGGEVLNKQLFSYFVTERIQKGLKPVQVTRSRAYKKNDNAHVEQRNDSIARKFLGYNRIDYQDLVPLINHYYANLVCPFFNHFLPSFKLADKIRIKSRTKRIYNDPVTPYHRIMISTHISQQKKLELQKIHSLLNPVYLSKQIDLHRDLIDKSIQRIKNGDGLAKNVPIYQLSDPLIKNSSNIVSVYQVFHHSKSHLHFFDA